MEERILLCDTTLRDGEQAPGVAFNASEKEKIARSLAETGIDELEVGVPAMGKDEEKNIKKLVSQHLPVRMLTWNRAVAKDLEASYRTGAEGVAISFPVSDQHIEHKLKRNRSWLLERMGECITQAKKEVNYICLGLEDGSRADPEFLMEVCLEGERLGVDRIRIADTLGILDPVETYFRFSEFAKKISIPLELHAHNDLGMATGNAVAAVRAGFKAVSVTVGGLGERTGNAPLEEVAVALKYVLKRDIRFDLSRLNDICSKVSAVSGREIPRFKPIVGQDVFTHTSSIHIDGMKKNAANYESFPPESVGRTHSIAFGKCSGNKSITELLESRGIYLNQNQITEFLIKVRLKSSRSKILLSEDEILAMVRKHIHRLSDG